MAYPPDETASMASSNSDKADRVDPGSLPSGMRSFLGHVHTQGSAMLKQNMDLVYYQSNQLVKIAIQGYRPDKRQASDISRHESKLTHAKGAFAC